LWRYGDLKVSKMAAVRRLGCLKFKFLTVCIVKRPISHHHAKFREDRSIRCCDIATFVIFKMAATVVSSTFVCLAKALLNVEESARDNYVLDCNFAKYLPI